MRASAVRHCTALGKTCSQVLSDHSFSLVQYGMVSGHRSWNQSFRPYAPDASLPTSLLPRAASTRAGHAAGVTNGGMRMTRESLLQFATPPERSPAVAHAMKAPALYPWGERVLCLAAGVCEALLVMGSPVGEGGGDEVCMKGQCGCQAGCLE